MHNSWYWWSCRGATPSTKNQKTIQTAIFHGLLLKIYQIFQENIFIMGNGILLKPDWIAVQHIFCRKTVFLLFLIFSSFREQEQPFRISPMSVSHQHHINHIILHTDYPFYKYVGIIIAFSDNHITVLYFSMFCKNQLIAILKCICHWITIDYCNRNRKSPVMFLFFQPYATLYQYPFFSFSVYCMLM